MNKLILSLLLLAVSSAYAETYNVKVYPQGGIDTSIYTMQKTPDFNKSAQEGFELGQKIKAAREKKNLAKKQEIFQTEMLSITNNMTDVSKEKLSLMLVKYPEFSEQIWQISKIHNPN